MPLGNASRTANVMDTMTSSHSTVSNTPLSSNSFVDRRDCPIHRRLWVLKAHDEKSQVSNKLRRRLNHNLFSVGQFCDADLEVAFRKSTCFIRDLKGNNLLTGSRGADLNLITLQNINSSNPIYLMAKATSYQAWLWHHLLSHLNFNTINLLSKKDIVVGLPKLKFVKDHLCSFCELGKAKRKSFYTKLTPSSKRRLQLLHMDLCGPMQTLHAYFAAEGILHQTSVARTPEQNGVVERQNRTLVEAARTMLSAAKKPLVKFFYIFGSICYIVRDGENLDKMKEKGNECIFVGYSTQLRAYRVFNNRKRVIMESIHVNFDELPHMASDQLSSDPAPEYRTVTTSNELDLLFSLMFDELLNVSSKVVSKSSTVSAADAPYQRQNHTIPLNIHTTPAPTCQVLTLEPTVTSCKNCTSLTKQERKCKLYDVFDKFAYQKGETLRDFYLRFSLLLNEMNMYNMKLEQFQVNTKFLNTLPPEWSKFVTDVKLQQASTYQSSPYTTSYHTPQFVSISYPMNDTSSTVNHNAYMASAHQIDYASIAYHPSELSSPETGGSRSFKKEMIPLTRSII
nr:integrase, catalytic region, zinc finger, CCHC-type, peptidase aspartic, catalytic [Tanacetum cinerariifolium]